MVLGMSGSRTVKPETPISDATADFPAPLTWIDFETSWESRTKRRMRRATGKIKWRVPTDAIFVGKFHDLSGTSQ
jgi:hypothetical protein